jgi:hypothetical protein
MMSAAGWMMRAWEMGNEAEFRALTTPNIRMVHLADDAQRPLSSNFTTNILLSSLSHPPCAGHSSLQSGRHWV